MNKFLPPLCLVLSLVLFISAFAVLGFGSPEPGMNLHRARVENDEQNREVLEGQLEQRRLQRKVLIGSLFGMAVVMVVVAFVVMRPSN